MEMVLKRCSGIEHLEMDLEAETVTGESAEKLRKAFAGVSDLH